MMIDAFAPRASCRCRATAAEHSNCRTRRSQIHTVTAVNRSAKFIRN